MGQLGGITKAQDDTIHVHLENEERGALTVTTHMCRGNNRSIWAASGYDIVANTVFSRLEVDGFLIDEQFATLELVIETADEVWGS